MKTKITVEAVEPKEGMSPSEVIMALHDVDPDSTVKAYVNVKAGIKRLEITTEKQVKRHD